MQVAEQDLKEKKHAVENPSVDVPEYQVGHRTKIVNSREYVKRLKRRQQIDSRVSGMFSLLWVILKFY